MKHPKIAGAVPIEIKLADKDWTLDTLMERLENQLVGQYLRAPECTHGVFVVGFVGGKSYWLDPVSSAHLSFEEVMLRLEKRAAELETEHQGKKVEAIKVIGIDFRAP